MKLIIAGSRTINDFSIVYEAFADLIRNKLLSITEIVSGCAIGVDTLAIKLGNILDIPVKKFPADWNKYGKSAGYKRNQQMAEYADILLLIWDGQSKGSKHMKDIMFKIKKPIYEWIVNA